MRIAYLDPVPKWAEIPMLQQELARYTAEGTEIVYCCLDGGGTDNYEYLTFEAMMIPEILKKVKKLEAEFDAVIIGCFFDPGLDALREMVKDTVIVGPAEASVFLANLLGSKFSVIAANDKTVPKLAETVRRYTDDRQIAGISSIGFRVTELAENPKESERRLEALIRKEIECNRAEVIILGCTLESGHFAKLQEKFGIPVIDPVIAAIRMAEYRIRCKTMCGWDTSRACTYKMPDERELSVFGLQHKTE